MVTLHRGGRRRGRPGYALTAPKQYQATAQTARLAGLRAPSRRSPGIDRPARLRRQAHRRRECGRAARAPAASRTPCVPLLGLKRSRDSLLDAVDAQRRRCERRRRGHRRRHVLERRRAASQTRSSTPLVNQRTATFQSQVAAAVRRYTQLLDAHVRESPKRRGRRRASRRRLAVLRTLAGQPDPSLAHAGQATAPPTSSWPDAAEARSCSAPLIGAAVGALVALALWWWRRRRAAGDRGVRSRAWATTRSRAARRPARRAVGRERVGARGARARPPALARRDPRAAQADAASGQDARLAELDRRRGAQLEERVAAVTDHGDAESSPGGQPSCGAALPSGSAGPLRNRARSAGASEEAEPGRAGACAGRGGPSAAAARRARGESGATGPVQPARARAARRRPRRRDFPDRPTNGARTSTSCANTRRPTASVPASFDWLIQDTFAELVP